jgi:hypothetical protein
MYITQSHIVYKVEIIFPQSLLHYEQNFPPLLDTLYVCRVKLFAAASRLFTHAVFQLLIFREMAYSGCIFKGANNTESEGAKLGL